LGEGLYFIGELRNCPAGMKCAAYFANQHIAMKRRTGRQISSPGLEYSQAAPVLYNGPPAPILDNADPPLLNGYQFARNQKFTAATPRL
jgi:hypothetical protein